MDNQPLITQPLSQQLSSSDALAMVKAAKDAENSESNSLITGIAARKRMLDALLEATKSSAVRCTKFGDRLTAQQAYEALDASKEAQRALYQLHSVMLNDIANGELQANNPLFAKLSNIIESFETMDALRNQFRDGVQKRLDTVNAVAGEESQLATMWDRIHLTNLPVKEAEQFMLFTATLEYQVSELNTSIQKSPAVSSAAKLQSTLSQSEAVKQLSAATVATRGILLDAGFTGVLLKGAGTVQDLNAFVTGLPAKLDTLKRNTKQKLDNILSHASIFGRSAVNTVLEHFGESKEILSNSLNLKASEKVYSELEKSRVQTEKQLSLVAAAMDGVAKNLEKLAGTPALSIAHIAAANNLHAFSVNKMAVLQQNLDNLTDKAGPLAEAAATVSYHRAFNSDLKEAHQPLLGKLGSAWKTMVDGIKNANAAITQEVPTETKRISLRP